MKKLVYATLLIIIGFNGIAQNQTIIDSLLNRLNITSNEALKADIFNELCWNYRVDSPKLGYEYGLKALNIYTKQNNILKQCNTLNKLGINKRNTAEYSVALDLFYKILSIAERPSCNLEIAYAYNNIADIYSILGKYDKALEYTNDALPLFESVGNQTGIAYNYNVKGNIYQNQKMWSLALKFFIMSHELRLKMNDLSGVASSNVNIGDCYLEMNLPDSAFVYYKKGMAYYNKAGLTNFGDSYISLGKYYASKKNYHEAIKSLSEAIHKAVLTKSPLNVQKANEVLHTIYYQQKDYKKAYEILANSKIAEDTLSTLDFTRKITTLELNLEFEQRAKAKEIEQIKKDALYESHLYKQKILSYSLILLILLLSLIAIFLFRNFKYVSKTNRLLKEYNEEISRQKIAIQTQNEQLQELNATKDKFFSIIAHDLKNPFYGILGISEHIVSSWPESTHEETVSMVKMIQESSQYAFNLLENLLEWSKAQIGRIRFNPEDFNFEQLLVEVSGLLNNLSEQKNISVNFHIPENLTLYADRNMIHTVMRNLISNAVKFSEPNKKIDVFAEQSDDGIKITVSDTGIGINDSTKNKLFLMSEKITSVGTNDEKGTGLGLLLCKEFIEKHNGKIWVESELGKGSKFIFTIPFSRS